MVDPANLTKKIENKDSNNIIIEIPIEDIKQGFLNYLKHNNTILFSAKFGMGKTYFLEKIFKINTDYEEFHLYPVNYQIHDNQNIIQLLKFDILVELLSKDKGLLGKDKMSEVRKPENIIPLLVGISKKIPKIGNIISGLAEIYNSYNEKTLEYFMDGVKQEKKESDYISAKIKERLIQLKEGDSNKKTVLILDDLDRLDPEHLFRLLNVFSAFLDQEGGNVFGFDKVIFVADYKNIKNIYEYKYGKNVDFEGYINKFVVTVPYNFNNDKAIKNKISDIIAGIQTKDDDFKKILNDSSSFFSQIFNHFCILGLDSGKLNLRHILKFALYPSYQFQNKLLIENRTLTIEKVQVFLVIEFLIELFNGQNELEEFLGETLNDKVNFKKINRDAMGDIEWLITKLVNYISIIDSNFDKNAGGNLNGKPFPLVSGKYGGGNLIYCYELLLSFLKNQQAIEDLNQFFDSVKR